MNDIDELYKRCQKPVCANGAMVCSNFHFVADSATTDDNECPSIIDEFFPRSEAPNLLVKEITNFPTNCTSKITTDPVISVCLISSCLSCQLGYCCTWSPCSCTEGDLDISHNIGLLCKPKSAKPCPPGSVKKYSCQTSTNFTPDQIKEPLTGCSNGQNHENFVLILQLKVPGTGK